MASIALATGGQAGLTDRLTGVVLPGLEATLQRLTADVDQWLALLSQVFAPDEAGSQELFAERAEQVREAIAAGSLSLTLELRTAEELQGGLAAYAAGAGERIYLNADWAVTATDQQLERVLLEEFGHALDQRLNGGLDTAGDEGEAFAALVFDGRIDPAVWEEKGEQESGTLWIDGVEVEVEFAKYNFLNAYRMVYDLNNDGLVKGSDSETAAEKEQSIHNFNVVGLGNVQINDGSANLNFSGNDISATAITIGGKVYYGWISRPIKANGIVRGFYFWTDRDFTDLTLAQFDGNADGDGSSADNRGFLLVVDQAWFDGQIAATSKTININNAIDGNLGAITYATVGSSSDRVDSALNDLPVSQQFVDTTDTDKDGVINVDDLDDDNDGILDVVEQQRPGATPLSPNNITFNYAQNTLGFASFHDAAGAYKTGDRNDPAFLFDGKIDTELRVHQNDVYEFGLPRTLAAGTSFSLTEGSGGNDKKIAVLGSFGSTDSTGNSGNATGAGQGWKTIATAFGVSTVGQLEALFQANNNQPVVRGNLILLFAGASDKTETFTTSIDINHFQLVGLETHGGWADLSISVESSQPLDIDGDTIPNYLDLDSDNDGISDLYEAVGSNTAVLAVAIDANNDGTITQAEVTDYNTKNSKNFILSSSGVWSFLGDPNVANDGQEPLDSDDDAIADFLDLDSDNDGIADTIEARLSSGYSTNDGDVRNEDADGDGVIARFDSNDANATKVFGGSFGTPVNTDSNKGGDGTTSTNAGHADKVKLDNSVDGEANALGAFDGKLAKLNSSKDELILDLGQIVPNGTTIKILAKKDDKDAANQITIGQSLDGSSASVSNSKSSGFTAKDVLQEITYATSGDSRYISIKFAKKKGNLYVDGLAWNYGATTNAYAPDYLDADSDNDGINDATESGLIRTGKDVNGDGIDDNVGASYADPDGSVNAPLGTSTGLKNNDKDASDVDFRSLNTGGVLINSVRVNEGSPWAVFSLTGPTSATSVKLRLINDLDPETANATIGTDLAADPFGGIAAVSDVQFLSGTTWTNYNPANGVTIPANGTLLVRVQIKNDNPAVFEGEETFRLVATDNNGAVSQGGLGIIVDDGSGDGFSSNNKTATADTDNITLDDDSPVDINSVTVNEGSPYAVFSLTGNPSAKILLSLANDTDSATKDATLGTDTGAAATAGTIQYWSGSAWTNYSTSVNLDSEGALLVRVKINNDTEFEQAETFRLVATVDSNKVTSTGGIGTIVDDGTGTIFTNTVTNGEPGVNAAGPFDDDSPITIDNPVVNEGSKWVVFDLEGVAGLQYKLSLTAQTASFFNGVGSQDATGGTHDYGPTIQYKDANDVWQAYNLTTAPLLAMDSAGHAEVRVAILQDSKYEGAETFKLVATSLSNVVSTGGQATIRDDGTGQLLNTLGNIDNVTAKDDDRAITVSGLDDVSEGSDAIFTVTLPDGNPRNTDISLVLAGISATAAVDYSTTFTAYYYNGSTKVDLPVASGKVTLPTGVTSFFVNVPTNQDPTYEGKEDFRLTATIVNGNSGNDTSSIVDDGTGKVYNLDGTLNNAATPDDDRPTIAVNSVTVSEESPFAVLEVSLNKQSNSAVSFTPSLVSKTATKATPPTPYATDGTDDFGPDLQYLDSADNTWKNVTGPLTIPAGSTSLLLRTAIIDDDAYEISEFFEITTGAVSGGVKNPTGVSGTVTIKDDGSPDVATFLDGNKTPTPDSIGPAENDKVDVFVLGGTFNEGSKYAIFTVGNTPDTFVDLVVEDGSASVLASGGQQPEILYSIDGGVNWVAYTWDGATGNRPKAPLATGGEFLVAVNITREVDTPFEGAETFTLKAKDAADTDEATGAATIVDDGTGKIVFLLNGLPVGGGNSVIEDTGTPKDDDRGVSVAGKPDVSEGSNAIFTVTLTGNPDGTDVSLVLGEAGDTAGVGDYSALAGATAYYYDGSTKTALPISEGKITLPAGVTSFFVSVPTTQDGAYEGPESLTLQASAFGGSKSGSASSTILDDGTGKVYDDKGVDTSGTPDDDRAISVTGSPDVSEGSNAIFTVTLSGNPGPGNTEVSLTLGKAGDTAGSGDYSALSGATAYYYDNTNTKQALTITDGKVSLPAGVTSFFVSVPTTQDAAYEGSESFTLEATAFGGAKSGSGTSSILDDGSGKFYDDKGVLNPSGGTPDDDRSVSVAGKPDVSEGSNAIFTVTLSGNPGPGNTEVSLTLGKAGDTAGSGDYSALSGATAYYYVGSTKTSLTITDGKVSLPAGVTSFFVSVPTTQDGVYEGPETVSLQASAFGGKTGSGSSTILDDGSGKVYDDKGDPTNSTPDDDRNITVTGKPDVSEGTNAIFTVALTGNPTGTNVTLELGAAGDTAATTDYNPLANATAYYFNGTVKTVLTITNGVVSLPPGITSFFVSVRTAQDTPYEGAESFTLKATAFGSKTSSDTSTILDDGTGKSYDDKGVPISGSTPDDDRTLAVTAYGPVNEASQYAMFTITAIAGNKLDLNLQNATSGTAAAWAGFTPLQFSTDGTNWTTYTGSGAGQPTVPVGGKVYVRVDITSEQDANFEGSETFALKAAYTTNTARSAFADTSIVDDGTGKKYGPDFSGEVPQESTDSLDADTGLSVNSITVNEGSSFAVFTVSGAANLPVSLTLSNVSSTGLTGLAYSLDNGLNWTTYGSGTVPLPASGQILVRTSLTPEQEALFENSETFTLTASTTEGGGSTATGTATIKDDGTGTVFNDNGTPNNTAVKDDDRALAVNSIIVNEGSPFAVFTLTANVGQTLSLGLSNGIQNTTARQGDGTPADGTEDYNPAVLQVWDPGSGASGAWVAYSGAFTVPGAGVGPTSVLARVKLNPDPVFEGPEDFRLTASYTSGASRSATGVATIVDNGTGTKYPDAPPNAGPAPVTDTTDLDDDRILIAVSSVTVSESAGFAEVTVSLSKAASAPISFTPFLTARTASLPSDFGPTLESSTDGGQSWQAVTGPLTFAVGQTSLRLRTTINDDPIYETTERFEFNTGAISSGLVANPSGAVGTVTITDDDVEILGSVAVQLRSTGNETGAVPNVFRITRSGNLGADLVVPFSLSSTSRFGIDYSDPSTSGVTFDATTSRGTVTIKAGESFVDLVIPTVDNALLDGTRALPLSITAPTAYTVSTSSAQGSILDNDTAPPPEVSIGKGNVVEPDLGQTRLVNLSLQLSRPATQSTTIAYDVIAASAADVQGRLGFDGQPLALATPGVDYTVFSGIVTLAAGLTSTIIQVPVIGDNLDENDELFYARIVSVSGGNGATISTAANRGEIIIIDNENTSGLNIDYSTSGNAIEIRGGTANDVITGSNFADTIYGNEGNDYLRGGLGSDTLTGGIGADIFSYTSMSDSTRASTDRLRDFAPGGGLSTGDRFQFTGQAAVDLRTATGAATVDGLPSAIYNASLVTPLTDLSAAITAAFGDKDLSRTGNQGLALGEAVIFTQGSGRLVNSYLIVNTGNVGYDASDFMVNITAWSSSGFSRGQLAVSDFFQSAFV